MSKTESLINSLHDTIAALDAGDVNPQHLTAKARAASAICKLAANRIATARLAGIKPNAPMMEFAGLDYPVRGS